ncbi:hypothetical protein FKM82_019379, partial [Ascaphus truei]
AQEFTSSLEANNSLAVEPLEGLDEMRIELDHSEFRLKELEMHIQQLERENQELHNLLLLQREQAKVESEPNHSVAEEKTNLTKLIEELQKQCDVSQSTQNIIQELQKCMHTLELNSAEKKKENPVKVGDIGMGTKEYALQLEPLLQELEGQRTLVSLKDVLINELQKKLNLTEDCNKNLLAKMDVRPKENAPRHELKLETDRPERQESQTQNNDFLLQLTALKEKLKQKEEEQKSMKEEKTKLLSKIETMESKNSFSKSNVEAKEKECKHINAQQEVLLLRIVSLEETLAQVQSDKERLWEECRIKEETLKHQERTTAEQLCLLEERLSQMSQNLCNHEKVTIQLISDGEHLTKTMDMEEQMAEQSLENIEVTVKNNRLQIDKAELNQARKNLEYKHTEHQEIKAYLEADMAKLTASEKQLQSQIDDALVSVDEKEKKIWDENKQLDENLQNARRHYKNIEQKLQSLETDYRELQDREELANSNLSILQTEHKNAKMLILQLEKNLASLKEREKSFITVIEKNSSVLQEKEKQLNQLSNEIEDYTKHTHVLEKEKCDMEKTCLHQIRIIESLTAEKISVEQAQLEQRASKEQDVKEMTSMMSKAEKQFELNIGEQKRLEAEIMDVTGKLNQTSQESEKVHRKLNVTEALLSEYQSLIQQLKEQIELLNLSHVEELMKFKEKEEQLLSEKEKIVSEKFNLEKNFSCIKKELFQVKEWSQLTSLESAETKETLRRTNTDIAELGIQIFNLTTEREVLDGKLVQLNNQLQEYDTQALQEKERLHVDLAAQQQENNALLEKLKEYEKCATTMADLQIELEETNKKLKSLQEGRLEEMSTVKFQMSTEILNCQNKSKAVCEELEHVKQELQDQNKKCFEVDEEMTRLQDLQSNMIKQLEQKSREQTKFESVMITQEGNATTLRQTLARKHVELEFANEQIEKYREQLNSITKEKDSNDQNMLANLDDLNRTKQYLEERLVELIRDKDALWQKSDALEFEQKIRAAERWMGDTEVKQCLECRKHFNWMLRRHHCRY